MGYKEAAADLQIDEDKLDQEWLRQPELFFAYSIRLANAKRQMEEERRELDVTKAEIENDVRNNPEDYGLTKATEASVLATVTTQKGLKDANKKLIEAKHHVDILQATVNALDHRRRALENLVDLHGQGYFAEPRAKNQQAREALGDGGKRDVRTRGQRDQEAEDE